MHPGVQLDVERLEVLCSRMVNHALDRPLRFELRPFSDPLEKAWSQAVSLVMAYDEMNIALPLAAAASFDEWSCAFRRACCSDAM